MGFFTRIVNNAADIAARTVDEYFDEHSDEIDEMITKEVDEYFDKHRVEIDEMITKEVDKYFDEHRDEINEMIRNLKESSQEHILSL